MKKLFTILFILAFVANLFAGFSSSRSSSSSRSYSSSRSSTSSYKSSSYSKPSSSSSYSYKKSSSSYSTYDKPKTFAGIKTSTLKKVAIGAGVGAGTVYVVNKVTNNNHYHNDYHKSYPTNRGYVNYGNGTDFYNVYHLSSQTGYGTWHPFNNPIYWMMIMNDRPHNNYYINRDNISDEDWEKQSQQKLMQQICSDFYNQFHMCVEKTRITENGVVVEARGQRYLAVFNNDLRRTEFKPTTESTW